MQREPAKYPLRLYNTLSRRVETFKPRNSKVKMFTCGPSIYNVAHIGNYRTFLYEDLLHRYLQFLGFRVDRLINFTDVEDKAIQHAAERNMSLAELTERAADHFYRAAGLLHIRLPDFIPRSSTSIDQAVRLITKLLQKGYAYRHHDNIFYNPLKFDGFGKLFRLDMKKWPSKRRRFWKDTYPGKRWNLGDFILWHAYQKKRDGPVFWETPLGRGRPSWNIQDPAMITKHLGNEVDICCGGVDNLYRHHDYTIAVIEALSGVTLSRFWLHGEHVLLEGRKMSKSRNNIVYPAELFNRGDRGTSLRFHLIRKHYRLQLNLTWKSLAESDRRCKNLRRLAGELIAPLNMKVISSAPEADRHIDMLAEDFARHMSDDLRVGPACTSLEKNLHVLVRLKNQHGLGLEQVQRLKTNLLAVDAVLQILFP